MNLKTTISTLVTTAVLGISAFAQTGEPVAVTLLKADGSRQIGFISATNDQGIKFAFTPEDRSGVAMGHAEVRAVSFTDEGDIMGPARHAYSRGNYEEAEKLFAAIATKYEHLWGISREQRSNFASEARYYQIDSLRRLGRYSEIAKAMETRTGSTLERALKEVYLPNLALFHLWSAAAAENWEEVAKGLKEYEAPLEGKKAELLTAPSFNHKSPNVLVQLYYIRGKLFESQKRTQDALRDYYRSMTLDYGSDPVLTKNAMQAALDIQAADASEDDNYFEKSEIHSLAVLYRDGYNKGDVDTAYIKFTTPPQMPEEMKSKLDAQKAEQEKAAAEKAAAEKAAAPADPAPKAPDADKKKAK